MTDEVKVSFTMGARIWWSVTVQTVIFSIPFVFFGGDFWCRPWGLPWSKW